MRNQIKYKGEMLAEDSSILKPGGVLYDAKELRADALEANSLQLTVVSESGTIKDFDLNDKVEYFRDGRRRGIYYLQRVTRVGTKSYEIYALSAVGRLMTMRHAGGLYTGETAEKIAREICGDLPVIVESVYASRQVYGWLPYAIGGDGRSARDNLADLLFSIGAWLGTDENGVLRIEKLWNGIASVIDSGRVDARRNAEKTEKPVSAVAVTEHQFVPNTDETELFSGTAEQGKLVIFDAPMHDLSADGFTVLTSGANYAVLSAGTGTLTGQAYTHNTSIVTRAVTAGASENIVAVNDVTLISLVNSSDIAARMADYYAHRVSITVDVNPTLERAGHVVQIYHPWDRQLVTACIASRETKISGLLKSRTSALVNFTPPQPDAAQYYDQRIVLTGSGTWTVPEGVTEACVVLIGQGSPGSPGEDGEAGGGVRLIVTSDEQARGGTWSAPPGDPGKGGKGGLGGEGGKVLVAQVDISAGDSIAYTCGSDAVFGTRSSAEGASSDAGYTDAITGDVYAARGENGIDGAPGGKGGTANANGFTAGETGGSVGEKTGGPGATGLYTHTPEESSFFEGGQTTAYGGGAGGGASVSANGSAPPNSPSAYGGAGADAQAPAAPTKYGTGGHGGHGGGGGGSAGGVWARNGASQYSGTGQGYWAVAPGGAAGKGSLGTAGANSCIIIYLRIRGVGSAGALATNDPAWYLDRLGRRVIV